VTQLMSRQRNQVFRDRLTLPVQFTCVHSRGGGGGGWLVLENGAE
jgi:hypothetical protein